MAKVTPTREGWQAITQAPSLVLCEITWRWVFGVALWAVLLYIVASSLGQVTVTETEYKLIRSFDPYGTSYVLLRVANAIVPTVLRVAGYTFPALVVLWLAAATIGRVATLEALLGKSARRINWGALIGVNLLRVVVLVAAVLAFVGSSILVGRLFRKMQELLGMAILLSLGINLLIAFTWSMLNWFLSLAPIFVVRDGASTFAGAGYSVELFRQRSGLYIATAGWLGLVRLLLIFVLSFVSLIPVVMIGSFPASVIVAVSVALALIYWALMDAVQIWRIAAYVSLAQYVSEPPVVVQAASPPMPPWPLKAPPAHGAREPESSF